MKICERCGAEFMEHAGPQAPSAANPLLCTRCAAEDGDPDCIETMQTVEPWEGWE